MEGAGLRNNFELPTGKGKGVPQPPEKKESVDLQILAQLNKISEILAPTQNLQFYQVSDHIKVAQPTVLDANSNLYVREQVFERLGRNAPFLYCYNDGPGTWFVRASSDGNNFPEEYPIKQGESNTFTNVYELRHRTPTEGLNYRISEHELKQQTAVNAAEKIEIVSTDDTVHFTGAIVQFDQEKENLKGLSGNRFTIRGVNIQSVQPLKFNLIFWSTSGFNNTDLNVDSFIDFVTLDMSASPTFRINSAGQYYLNVGNLEILYEDLDVTRQLHISLQDLSAAPKNAGATGEVQIDIKMSPRL